MSEQRQPDASAPKFSRQYKWQQLQAEKGLCRNCGKGRHPFSKVYCLECSRIKKPLAESRKRAGRKTLDDMAAEYAKAVRTAPHLIDQCEKELRGAIESLELLRTFVKHLSRLKGVES